MKDIEEAEFLKGKVDDGKFLKEKVPRANSSQT
jgi:hypothetical protein